MKRYHRFVGFSLLLITWTACVDRPLYDVYQSTNNRRWYRHERQVFRVDVKEKSSPYDIWLSIRHTGEYSYTDLSFSAYESGPGLVDTFYRHELHLATADGRWTGKRAGNLYENRLLLKENYVFPDTGMYTFEIEQEMTDNPILDITDVGLKIIAQ